MSAAAGTARAAATSHATSTPTPATSPTPAAYAPPTATSRTPTAYVPPTPTTAPLADELLPDARSLRPEASSPASSTPNDVLTRRDRLDKIKRRVADAARPAARIDPVPADPARAAESVLGLVRDLEGELGRARDREEALRADLDGARQELAKAAGEARGASERLVVAERELEEKRGVLGDLLAELEALEDERDGAVRRAQALAALDEERARLLDEVSRRAEEEARLRAEREAEVERLGEELRTGAADGARLRTAVGELARERDQLAAELDRLRAERDDLATAKRALEQVHAALAQARARLG